MGTMSIGVCCHEVDIMSVVFCFFYSLLMLWPILVMTIWWKRTEYGYCYALHVAMIVSFCFPPCC